MPNVFFPNLMFEEQLSGSPISHAAALRSRDLAVVMGLLAESAEDVVLVTADGIPQQLPACLAEVNFSKVTPAETCVVAGGTLVPWGANEVARRTAERLDLRHQAPASAIVSWINSRQFLSSWDHVTARSDGHFPAVTARPFSTICGNMEEVHQELRRVESIFGPEWIIKADLSQAARNRLLGRGQTLSTSHLNWLQKQFLNGRLVAVEPWVRRVCECGLQFTVGSDNSVVLDGITQLVNTPSGGYLGSLVFGNQDHSRTLNEFHDAVIHGHQVAAAAAEAGYYGWMGIDCMIFEMPNGARFLRMAHDLNGRCTMGRVALNLSKWLQPEELGFWGHFPAELMSRGSFSFANMLSESVRIIPTSPGAISGQPLSVSTAFFASADPEAMSATIQYLSKR